MSLKATVNINYANIPLCSTSGYALNKCMLNKDVLLATSAYGTLVWTVHNGFWQMEHMKLVHNIFRKSNGLKWVNNLILMVYVLRL